MRRGRYLKSREQLLAFRRPNEYAPKGVDLLRMRNDTPEFNHETTPSALKLYGVISRRLPFSRESTDFSTGTNEPQEIWVVNMQGQYNMFLSGDQVVMHITDSVTDLELYDENKKLITVKSADVGVNLTRLICVEL